MYFILRYLGYDEFLFRIRLHGTLLSTDVKSKSKMKNAYVFSGKIMR